MGSAGPSALPVGEESCVQEREFLPSLPIRLRETSDSRRQAPTTTTPAPRLCLPHGNEVRGKNVQVGFSPKEQKNEQAVRSLPLSSWSYQSLFPKGHSLQQLSLLLPRENKVWVEVTTLEVNDGA